MANDEQWADKIQFSNGKYALLDSKTNRWVLFSGSGAKLGSRRSMSAIIELGRK